MSKQSIMDRMTAAKHSIAGQGLAKVVCKATTEEVMGPKKKHLDYLLQCTNEPNVSIPQLADLLIERTQNQSWVIVFKALITIHNLMNYGNERFTQYLASNNCTFQLGSFIDKGGVQGYDMSTFIRRYSKYLNEKAVSYRSMAFDFCKVRRGKDDGLLRTMNSEKLLKTLPALQRQLDALLEFDCTSNELTNGVINACFLLMFKDLIRLFACYNDGVINLLEKYFDMNKKQCKDALDLYKKFLVRMDKVSEFLKTAEHAAVHNVESVGIDKSDIPDLAKGLKSNAQSAPSSLLDALEQHYQSLDSKKGATTPGTAPKPAGFASAINTISNNTPEIQISEEEKKRILDEENARLQQLKAENTTTSSDSANQEQRLKETGGQQQQATQNASNPFGAPASTPDSMFGSPSKSQPDSAKPSDDLLNLTGNPFVQNVQNVMAMNAVTSAMNNQNSFATPQWNAANPNVPATSGTFSSDVDFEKVFPNSTSQSTGLGADSGMLQPALSPETTASVTQEELFDPKASFSGGASTNTTSTTMAIGGIFSHDIPATNADLIIDASQPAGTEASNPFMEPVQATKGATIDLFSDHSQPSGTKCKDLFTATPSFVPESSNLLLNTSPTAEGKSTDLLASPSNPSGGGSSDLLSDLIQPSGGGPTNLFSDLIQPSAGGSSNLFTSPVQPSRPDNADILSGSPQLSRAGNSSLLSGLSPVPGGGQSPMYMSPVHGPVGGTMRMEATSSLAPSTAYTGSPMMPRASPALQHRSVTPTLVDPAQGRDSPAEQGSGFDAFGEVLKPTVGTNSASGKSDDKLINQDLDTSLVQLAGNLNIKGSGSQVKKQQHEWQPKGDQKITGGTYFQGKPAMASTTWTQPAYPQPMMAGPGMGYPGMMQPGMMGMRPMGMQPQPMGMQPGMMGQPMAMGMGQQPMYGVGMQPMTGYMQQPRPQQQNGNDPFGAL